MLTFGDLINTWALWCVSGFVFCRKGFKLEKYIFNSGILDTNTGSWRGYFEGKVEWDHVQLISCNWIPLLPIHKVCLDYVTQYLIIVYSTFTIPPFSFLHSSKVKRMLVLSTSTHYSIDEELHICSSMVLWRKEQPWVNDYSLALAEKNEVREIRKPFQIGSGVFAPQKRAEVEVRQQRHHSFAPISSYKQLKPWLLGILRPVQFTVAEVFYSFLTWQQTQALLKI